MERIIFKKTDFKTCFCETEFLYGQYSPQERARKTPVHSHACWQLEGMVKGCAIVKTNVFSGTLTPDRLFIIPPGCTHHFIYNGGSTVFISLKFSLNIPEKYRTDNWEPQIAASPEIISCYEMLIKSLDRCSSERETAALISSIEHLTASVIEKVYFLQEKDIRDPITSRLKWLINKSPNHSVKVKEVSKLLKCNKKYIAAHIRNETGMTIKEFIDSERAEIAAQTLSYSRNTIGEIAYMLGYPDQYTFSRFFKKLKGVSPREFRKNLSLPK